MAEDIRVPDLGGADSVEVIEISVNVGDSVAEEDPILVLESDKASVELPAPKTGKITALNVSVGDRISEGDVIGQLEAGDSSDAEESSSAADTPAEETPAEEEAPAEEASDAKKEASASGSVQDIHVPDLGGAESVEVIEISVTAGDSVEEEAAILVVESDKASVELPAPAAGTIKSISVKVGDRISEGDVVGQIEVSGGGASPEPKTEKAAEPAKAEKPAEPKPEPAPKAESKPEPQAEVAPASGKRVHAGPAVRRLARELGADLGRIQGSGPKNRILKEDVQAYIKQALAKSQEGGAVAGTGLPGVKLPDFSQFGDIERESMSRLMKLTADSMQRSWLNVPHVTQFEQADITEMEAFRKSKKGEGEKRGVKLTPMAFLLKICANALKAHPNFNVSLDMDRKEIIRKRYIHIGIAVDTPDGLVVPVIRNVDQKGLWELAEECQTLAQKARDKKLSPKEMQGACFTITSLGGIGGTAFTPIVNTPEVAILGVSKSSMAPVWDGSAFQPRLMLPLSLSYDHRAINGADAARFTNTLREGLEDLRQLLL
ncbi:dihydrolipoyllysine-residue acetyltransferase [Marinobacter nanhaiticus D15-8W]|uniref:Acetyltransferase component of pyruvate dehydrogenase complex n=1 Tax=Marinobacter nanhaiticus D15-8W TaxID=626887 RepID=N6W0R5_9GAMM|nr:dihydrolipoyllysine-residue acetyltransferase [Marinobacter nanhaiticus]ENO13689.1 dihydrolipoyllysine-residue acetyltransferase [Marinobacter nanhaiticus D15-8W]BES71061.1 dihydrolipoyllysine-residue acetyltransferase [Marinobacter nanhaiticus D15-8W]